MLQAIFFDYDGTLAPTSKRQEKWFQHYSFLHGKPWNFSTLEEFMEFYNKHTAREGGVQNVYDELGLPCEMKNRSHPVWPAYEAFNKENPMKLYTGVRETIEAIWKIGALNADPRRNRRLRLGINTTNSWASIYNDLTRGGIADYIDGIITTEFLVRYHGNGDGESIKKPSTISLALLLGLLDCEGASTLHVGDTRNDLRASQKVMRLNPLKPETLITVGACYGYEGRKTLEQGVETTHGRVNFDYLIDAPNELVEIVRGLMRV